MAKILTMADVAAADDIEYHEIEAFNGVFLIGSLMTDDFLEWQDANDGPAKRTAGLRLIQKSVCGRAEACPRCDDVEGVEKHTGLHPRVGTEKDLAILKSKSVASTEKIVKQIVKLNGLSVKGESDAKNA